MTDRTHRSILLVALLVLAAGLSTALAVFGPDRVERRAVEMFRTQQSLVAEQGARRIAESIRDAQTRIDEAAERLRRHGPPTDDASAMRSALKRLDHPFDDAIGLALLATAKDGAVLTVEPGIETSRARELSGLELSADPTRSDDSVRLCAHCLQHHGSVSIFSEIEAGRMLVANIDLSTYLSELFRTITEDRHAHAALLDADGEILFEERRPATTSANELLEGTATVPGSEWRVSVATPRSAIAPEVRSTTKSVVYSSIGVVVVVLLALGVFGWSEYREYRDRIDRLEKIARTDKLATVGMLGSSISHEIRNIVTAVDLNLQLIAEKGPPELEAHLERASESIGRLEELSENITGFVSERGDPSERFTLSEAVRGAVDLLQPKLDDGLLDVEVDADPVVEGSRVAIEQVTVNLLLNAYDAVEATSEGTIAVTVERSNSSGIVEVADNGGGIDPAILDQIFEPFTSTKGEDSEGGTGLGLWLSAEIVEQHGGTIRAANRDSGGAVFVVQLPATPSAPPDETSTGPPSTGRSSSRPWVRGRRAAEPAD